MSNEFYFIGLPGATPEDDDSVNYYADNEQQQELTSDPEDNSTQELQYESKHDPSKNIQRISMEEMMALLNTAFDQAKSSANSDNLVFRMMPEPSTHTLTFEESFELERKKYRDLVQKIIQSKQDDMIRSTERAAQLVKDKPELFAAYNGKVTPDYSALIPNQIALATAQAYLVLAQISINVTLNKLEDEDSTDKRERKRELRAFLDYISSIIGLIEHHAV